jgi:transposase
MSGDNFSRRYSVVAEVRRRWSEAEKQAIVAEAARPGVNISAVARRHGIKPSLLFRWRRLARDTKDQQSTQVFIPVTPALPRPKRQRRRLPLKRMPRQYARHLPQTGSRTSTASRSRSAMSAWCGSARASIWTACGAFSMRRTADDPGPDAYVLT